jgi:hypothetical protein
MSTCAAGNRQHDPLGRGEIPDERRAIGGDWKPVFGDRLPERGEDAEDDRNESHAPAQLGAIAERLRCPDAAERHVLPDTRRHDPCPAASP